MSVGELIGRDRELEAIVQFLNRQRGVLLLEGEAGIGKTTLWRRATELAAAHSYRVLSATTAASEAQLAYAAVRDLLEDLFEEVETELPAPQRHALEVALLRAAPRGRPPVTEAVVAGFLGAIRVAASAGPVLVAVDDVQWLDPSSALVLSFTGRRLGDQPITLLLARRGHPEDPLPLELDRAPHSDALLRIAVGPLSAGALNRLIQTRLGISFPRPTLLRLHETSAGNPFFALELARALAAAPASVGPGGPLPVPTSLRELLRDRLGALPAETLDALLVVSALPLPRPRVLEAVLGRDPVPVLRPAVDAQVLEETPEPLCFHHPLYAAAVYDAAPPERRREVHRRLADIVEDPEERALHLALAVDAPDDEVARIVEEGARLAAARGSPAAAAELASQARRLTPAESWEDLGRRTLSGAEYRFEAGDTVGASTLLDELAAEAEPGPWRARLLSRQARLRHFERDISGSVELLRRALAEAGDDAALRSEIEEGLAWGLLLMRADLAAAAAHARSSVRFAEQAGDPAALAEALAAEALTEFVLGADSTKAMQRALALEGWTLHLRVLRHPAFAKGYCLSCADDFAGARAVFQELLVRARDRGDEGAVPSLLNHLALVECLSGNWDEAVRLAEEGYELALECGQRPTQASILAKLALVAARRGDVEQAREMAARSLAIAAGADFDAADPAPALARGGETAIWTLGFLELTLDRADEAYRILGPLTNRLLAAGIREPGEVRCLPDTIAALVALGRTDESRKYVRLLEDWGCALGRPSVLAAAAFCRGLQLAATGESDAGITSLEQAAVWYGRSRHAVRAGPRSPPSWPVAPAGDEQAGGARGARGGSRRVRAAGSGPVGGARARRDGQDRRTRLVEG